MLPFNIFALNLPHREDRRQSLINEFSDKSEFKLQIVNPEKHEIPSYSFWLTLKILVYQNMQSGSDFFIFCEDDISFTTAYSLSKLQRIVTYGEKIQADVILGGISWFNNGINFSEDLFWVDIFTGTHFSIIYQRLYNRILTAEFTPTYDSADLKISSICEKKFVVHPFLAIQKDFGYSDVTAKNNMDGRQNDLFTSTTEMIDILKKVQDYHSQIL